MLIFPDPNVETEYTDPNGSVWAFNGTGWVRQPDCPDGGGGGDAGDNMWPSPPKPSVDLLATRQNASGNGQGRGTRLFQVADDGTLSEYDFISTSGAGPKVEFCPNDTLLALNLNDYNTIAIYDYSTAPCQQVATFQLPWGINDWAWSANGQYIFCCENNGTNVEVWKNGDSGWEKYAPNSRILDDVIAEEFSGEEDPEQMLLAYNCLQLCAVNGAPQNEEAFLVTMNFTPSDSEYQSRSKNTVNLVKATPSGCVVIGGDSGLVHDPGASPSGDFRPSYTIRVLSHPHSGLFAYHGRGALRNPTPFEQGHIGLGRAALFSDGSGVCSAGTQMAERWVGANDNPIDGGSGTGAMVESAVISPSGNYLIAKRQDKRDASIFRIHTSGVLERLGFAPEQRASGYSQWSADERYLYRWIGAKIERYEWNDGAPVFVDDQITNMETPVFNAGSTNNYVNAKLNTHMNRSKF